jgi:hypothetical protein
MAWSYRTAGRLAASDATSNASPKTGDRAHRQAGQRPGLKIDRLLPSGIPDHVAKPMGVFFFHFARKLIF